MINSFESAVCGIPCRIEVIRYYNGVPDTYWEPPEPRSVEIRILDQRGRHAEWLERKMKDDDWREKEAEALEWYCSEEY